MNRPTHYKRAAIRMLFVVLLFLVMAAPQLMSPHPASGFIQVRDLLENTPLTTWVLIGAGALVGLWFMTTVRKIREQAHSPKPSGTYAIPDIEVQDAVSSTRGGNGLVSQSFLLELPWLGIAGWLNIRDFGKECIVVGGRSIVRNTRLYFTPMRLIGKPIYARRVLLQPAPLTDLSAKSLTKDQLELTLVTSVSYTVANPAYVATLQAPLTELNNLITGAIAEYVRSDTLENIVRDDGTLRLELKKRLEASPSIKGYYKVTEVLKALPTGDERIIEIIRKTREATARQTLIEQTGINETLKAKYDQDIARAKAELQDEFREREHRRDLEKQQLQLEAQTLRELVNMVAQVAIAGINPTGTVEEIRKLLHSPSSINFRETPLSALPAESTLITEQQRLERHKAALGITSFEIKPHPTKPDFPGQAQINFPEFTLFDECSAGYPQQPPSVRIQLDDGNKLDMTVPWQAGSHLTEVAVTAKMRVQSELENRAK